MNTVSKSTSLQTYTMLLMRKAVHPEFFGIENRRQLTHGQFDVEAWIYKGGHAVRFQQLRGAESDSPTNGTAASRLNAPIKSVSPRQGSVKPSSGLAPKVESAPICLCEVVTEQPEALLDLGVATTFPCAGERDHEERLSDAVLFMTTLQTETLTEHLYLGTYKEMMQHVREANSIFSAWTDELGRPNLSLLDLQRYRNEVHVQGYHLRSDCGLVLRTQSMFQVEGRPTLGDRTSAR